ncbi:MAG TPA: hypothetical protein VHV50_14170 [Actinomycetota bacterium]|jgi:hypothetical protein|nr:hypothetical protein [Actinomycetota bacterium]
MRKRIAALRDDRRVRELSHGFALLAVTGSSVGGVMGMVVMATKALGH